MSRLPKGWVETHLGNLGVEIRGSIRPLRGTTYELYSVPTYPTGRPEIVEGTTIGSNKRLVKEDDVLLCKINPRINRVWIVGPSLGVGPQIASTEYLVFRTGDRSFARYLRWYLQSPPFRRWIEMHAEGATGSHTRAKSAPILEQSVPVPPLAEQDRIVAAIEEQFSRLDAAEAALRRAQRNVERMRRATIVAAIPNTLPAHWKLRTVADVGRVELGRQRAPKYHHGPNMRPYLRVANVFEDRIDLSDVKEMHFSDNDWNRYRLSNGDILLNEGQSPELVGRPAMFRGEMEDVAFTNSLIRFRPHPEIDGEFALLVFRRHLHSKRFMQEARIVTNIAHMAAGRFKAVEFPVPPLDEQKQIVEQVQRDLSLISSLAATITHSLIRSAHLRRSVLERAFTGQLVPQDPNDEPASILLERIVSSREPARSVRKRGTVK